MLRHSINYKYATFFALCLIVASSDREFDSSDVYYNSATYAVMFIASLFNCCIIFEKS